MSAKPKLLVLELWGLGDLVIATPFLRTAAQHYDVTLVAKPFAMELGALFWPSVVVEPLTAPWTAFLNKYRLWHWPWRELASLRRRLVSRRFDLGLSARRDPRDHLLLKFSGAGQCWGFPRWNYPRFLTHSLKRPKPDAHVSEYWRIAGKGLGLENFPAFAPRLHAPQSNRHVLIHSGARLPVRVWPLTYYLALIRLLRQAGFSVDIVCDADQLDWWKSNGEAACCPANVTELCHTLNRAAVVIANDSGPGHLAALCGIPTFSLFGPQLPDWFAPVNKMGDYAEGKACPYKPCFDYCRFPRPFCLENVTVEEVWPKVSSFLMRLSAMDSIVGTSESGPKT